MSQDLINSVKNLPNLDNNKEIDKVINQHPRIVKIKKRAKILKKEEQYKDTALSSLLDIASKELGFKHWHEAYTNIKNRYYPKSYKLNDLYSFGLSKPANMIEGIHIGHSAELNMNLWNSHKILLTHTTIFGNVVNRNKLHSYLFKQAIKNNYSLTLVDNTNLINELEEYINEENIQRTIYKLKFINREEYLESSDKENIEKTTCSLLNSYIEFHFEDIFHNQDFSQYSLKEKEQIKALSQIVFFYFYKNKKNKKFASCSNYYESIKSYVELDYLMDKYPQEPLSYTYSKGDFTQNYDILNYLKSLDKFNLEDNTINSSSIQNHNKIKNTLLDFFDYLENNLYCYFENDNTLDIIYTKINEGYLYNISISPSLLDYNTPMISHLIMNILYKNADMKNLFEGINVNVLKKEHHPLPAKNMLFIKDCPLPKDILYFTNIATSNNNPLVFSYEDDIKLMNHYQACGYASQYIICKSKKEIIDNDSEEVAKAEFYYDENLYIHYKNCNYVDENNEVIEHYLTLSLKKYSEEKLLNMKLKI